LYKYTRTSSYKLVLCNYPLSFVLHLVDSSENSTFILPFSEPILFAVLQES